MGVVRKIFWKFNSIFLLGDVLFVHLPRYQIGCYIIEVKDEKIAFSCKIRSNSYSPPKGFAAAEYAQFFDSYLSYVCASVLGKIRDFLSGISIFLKKKTTKEYIAILHCTVILFKNMTINSANILGYYVKSSRSIYKNN